MFFYDPSAIDNENDDDAKEALRQAEAKSYEAVCFLVDLRHAMVETVLPSGQTCLQHSLTSLENYLKSRIIGQPNDRVAVVLYGTRETKNEYGLDHVYVLRDLGHLDARYIREVQNSVATVAGLAYPESENHRGLSLKLALWTCSHMLKDYAKMDHVCKRIFLFTNDDDPCGGDDLLTSQILGRLGDLGEMGVSFELNPLGDPGKSFSPKFWGRVAKDFEAATGEDGEFLQQMQLRQADTFEMIRKKINRKRRSYQTRILVGDKVKVEVEYYVMVQKQDKTPKTVDAQTNAALTSSTAWICNDTGEVLPDDEDPVNGWTIRGETVIASAFEYESIKNAKGAPLGFNVLGFQPREALLPYYSCKSSGFLYPNERDHPGSCKLFLAFHEKMLETDRVAICTMSHPYKNSSGVRLVALMAQQEAKDEYGNQLDPPGLWVLFLPFADDLRAPELVSKAKGERARFAEADMIRGARDLIGALSLDEDWDSTYIANPALQRHYGILQSLALGEDPTLRAKEEDETLPDSERFARGEGAIADFFARLPEMARAKAAPRKRKWDGAKGKKA